MASCLPPNPSLERLRNDARGIQRGVLAGDPHTLDLIRRHHPRADTALADAPQHFGLHDAQLALARRYGFPNWPALVRYLTVSTQLRIDPGAVDETSLNTADRFCALSSLRYDHTDAPPRHQAGAELLAAEPALVHRSIWAAAAAADPDALVQHLAENSDLAGRPGGPFGWPPLLYLCYSRAPLRRSKDAVLDSATALLDAGADPNAGYLWCGLAIPFTALTGVFGEGEQGPRRQPRHPFSTELATLLLRRGAHPADQQTLYNRMFRPDDSHLELLFAHGLSDAGPSPWESRLGEAMESREQMWKRQIDWAAQHGFTARLTLLAENGIDVSGAEITTPVLPDDPNARDDNGATPLHHAAWAGDIDLIRRLLAAGADPKLADEQFGTTPAQWAEHAYQNEAAALLENACRTER